MTPRVPLIQLEKVGFIDFLDLDLNRDTLRILDSLRIISKVLKAHADSRSLTLSSDVLGMQTPGDELKWVRNATDEDTITLASLRGMVICIACKDDKVYFDVLILNEFPLILGTEVFWGTWNLFIQRMSSLISTLCSSNITIEGHPCTPSLCKKSSLEVIWN